MGNDLWRWADPDGQQRRVRLDELRASLAAGIIAPNAPVWRAGWSSWQPAHEVPELTSASVGGANGVVLNIPPPPLAMVAVQQQYEATSESIVPLPLATENAEEPPPPPAYVPLPVKAPSIHPSSAQIKTQLGGSAYSPGSVPPSPAAPAQTPSLSRLGASLPTSIGLAPAPMPMMKAPSVPAPAKPAAEATSTSSRSVPPLPPRPPLPVSEPVAPPFAAGDAVPIADPFGHSPATEGLPPPTDPVVHDTERLSQIEAEAGLPRGPLLKTLLDDIQALRERRPPKNKPLLIGVFVSALFLFVMMIAGIASIASGPPKTAQQPLPPPSTSGTASAKLAAVPTVSTPAAVSTIPPPPPPTEEKPSGPVLGDCTTRGEEKTIAPRALIASGIEALAMTNGLALGFAAAPRDAVATTLDPTTLAPSATVRARPALGDAKRVTPMLVAGKLTAIPDVERKGDRIGGRRVVALGSLIDVGFAEGNIVWAPHGKDSFAKLFALEGETAIEAMRAIPLPSRKGIAVAFRRGNAIHVGAAQGENALEADGQLSRIAGLGQVGAPSLSVTGDRLVVAWADRASEKDEWKVRWASTTIGGSIATSDARELLLPEGGLGGNAMSPSLAALGGGRFLLTWTEGPVSSHQVRALTFGADGSPSGAPLVISGGVNAGQPAAVVGSDGQGVVAFLAAKGKALEVHATPITCPPR